MKKIEKMLWKVVPLAVLWSTWKHRTDCVVNGSQPNFEELCEVVKARIALWAKSSPANLEFSVTDILNSSYGSSVHWKLVTAYKSTKKALNLIDSCWRTNPKWDSNRCALADCAVGFGAAAIGGKYGATYVVTDPSDDPINPKLGSLRYSVIQTRPLWIIFARDMVITLKSELMTNSYKTIDGRGVKVEIAYGPCITIKGVSHVIVHEITIHDCKRGKSGTVRNSKFHAGHRADRMRCHCCVCFFSYLD
ncbi:hypothetical protein ACSBR1_016466 [Camellia fascicularis]